MHLGSLASKSVLLDHDMVLQNQGIQEEKHAYHDGTSFSHPWFNFTFYLVSTLLFSIDSYRLQRECAPNLELALSKTELQRMNT